MVSVWGRISDRTSSLFFVRKPRNFPWNVKWLWLWKNITIQKPRKKKKNYGSWSCLLWHIFLSRLYKNIKNIILLYHLVTKAWFIGPDHNSRLIHSTLEYDQGSCIIIVRKLFCIPPKKINSYTINDMGRPYVKYFHSTICWFHLINPAR